MLSVFFQKLLTFFSKVDLENRLKMNETFHERPIQLIKDKMNFDCYPLLTSSLLCNKLFSLFEIQINARTKNVVININIKMLQQL